MMDGILALLKERRLWIAALPVVVMFANAAGVPLTEEMLTDTGDKVLAAVASVLALWSWFAPKS